MNTRRRTRRPSTMRRRRRRPAPGRSPRGEPSSAVRRGATERLLPGRALLAAMQGADSEFEAARGRAGRAAPAAREYLARRFGNRGEPHEDLVQVGDDRADQGDRPVRPRARGRVLDVRHPDHRRRDQAPLPRPRLDDPGAAAAPGDPVGHQPGRERPRPGAGPLPHGRRARRPGRDDARRRSSRGWSRRTPTARCPSTPPTRAVRSARSSSSSATTTTRSTPSWTARRSSRCSTSSTPATSASCCCGSSANMTQSQIAEELGHLADARLPAAQPDLADLRKALEERSSRPGLTQSGRSGVVRLEGRQRRGVEDPGERDAGRRTTATIGDDRRRAAPEAAAPTSDLDELRQHERRPGPGAQPVQPTRRSSRGTPPYSEEERHRRHPHDQALDPVSAGMSATALEDQQRRLQGGERRGHRERCGGTAER